MAATVNIAKDLSSPLTTSAIASFETHGGQMGGTVVTAAFSDGTSQTAVWAPTSPGFGQVLTNLFLLGAGNTSSSSWLLLNLNPSALLTGLTVDVGAGNHVFDTASPSPGTANTAGGSNFSDTLGFTGSISVTYSRPVGLTGFSPVGDIFTVMTVNFAGLQGGGLATYVSGLGFNFLQDTDALATAGDLESSRGSNPWRAAAVCQRPRRARPVDASPAAPRCGLTVHDQLHCPGGATRRRLFLHWAHGQAAVPYSCSR